MVKMSGLGIKVALRPGAPDERGVRVTHGSVEIGGVDISSRVGGLTFERTPDGMATLGLTLYLDSEDAIEIDVAEADVTVHAVESTARGVAARRMLDRAAAV